MINLYKNATLDIYKDSGIYESDGDPIYAIRYRKVPTVFSFKRVFRDPNNSSTIYIQANAVVDYQYSGILTNDIVLCSMDGKYYRIMMVDPKSSVEDVEFFHLTLEQDATITSLP